MRILGFHVDGFGRYRDFREDGIVPGLNVILGPNEAGKSTLHAFLRGMLHGFRGADHPPLSGGNHGGSLRLDTAQGELRITRTAGARRPPLLEGPDGSRLEPHVLEGLLRGVDAGIYRSVFAFDLDDLAGLDSLSSEEIGPRLFDAGLSGAGRSVSSLLEELDKRKRGELAPRSGRIRALAREVEALQKKLREAEARGRDLGGLHAAESSLETALVDVRRRQAAAKAEAGRWQLLLRLWPAELARRQALAGIAGAGGEPVLIVHAAACDALLAEAKLQADRIERARSLTAKEAERQAALETLLASMGSGWSLERARQVDWSVRRRDAIGHFAEELLEGVRGSEGARLAQETALGDLERWQEEQDRLEAKVAAATSVPSQEELDRRRALLAEARAVAPPSSGPMTWITASLLALVAAVAIAFGQPLVAGLALAAAVAALALGARAGSGAAQARERAAAAARELGLGKEAGPGELERVAAELERGARERQGLDERLRELETTSSRRQAALSRCAEAALRLRVAEERVSGLRQAWAEHAADLGATLSPAAALELLQRASQAVESGRIIESIVRDRRELEAASAAWNDAAAALLLQAGVGGAAEAGLRFLATRIEEERSRLAERRGFEERLAEATRELERELGQGEEAEALRKELEEGEKSRWEAALAELDATMVGLDAALEDLAGKLERQRAEREALENSADVPQLAAELAAAKARLAEAADRWRAAALLERVLQGALEEFQRERQPQVLRHAGRCFATITAGRYAGVVQPATGRELLVVDGGGRSLPAAALSRGAKEQLYLCVRLGLVEAFAERGVRLPLLLDDVLVNFDPERAMQTARLLAEVAREHQLLLFTCHPETLARLRAADPSLRSIELPAFGRAA